MITAMNRGSARPHGYQKGLDSDECRCPLCQHVVLPDELIEIQTRDRARAAKIEEDITARLLLDRDAEIERIRTDATAQIEAAQRAATKKEAAIRQEAARVAAAALAPKLAKAEQETKRLKANQEAETKRALDAQAEALTKAADERVAAIEKARFEDNQKHQQDLEHLKRRTAKERPAELGERGEVDLFETLKEAFGGENGDDFVKRVARGVNGPDVVHRVLENRIHCGTIVYDSKNASLFSHKWVPKLCADQKAAAADHAVLVTNVFPRKARELLDMDDVVVVSPARVLEIVRLLRRMVVLSHRLKLSGEDRAEKTAQVYSFINSPEAAAAWKRIDVAVKAFVQNEKVNATHQVKTRDRSLDLIEQIRSAVQDDFLTRIDRIMRGLPQGDSP